MSGRKNKFSRALNHLKSNQIDEKINFLNKQLKKTGVISEDAPTNNTSSVYTTFEFVPPVNTSAITSKVPDTTGFVNGGTQDVNGGDENDSSTWDTGWNNITDFKNSDNLNGETDRNIPITPDLSGWNGSGSASSNDPITSGSGGICVWTISSGVGGGKAIGTLSGGNIFIGPITVPDNVFGTYVFPSLPQSDPYLGYNSDEFDAARNIAIAYENSLHKGSVTRLAWVPYDLATESGGPTYDEFTGTKKTSGGKQLKLKLVSVLSDSNPFTSKDAVNTPSEYNTLTRNSIDDANFYPGNLDKFMDFLRGAFDVGEKALDYLMNAAGEVADIAGDLAGALDWASGIADSVSNNTPHIADEPSDAQKQDYLNEFDPNAVADSKWGTTTPINDEKQNFADDNIYVDDSGTVQSNIGPNGEKGYYETPNAKTSVTGGDAIGSRGEAQTQIYQNENGDWVFAYDDHAYWNINSDDAGEISNAAAEVAANIVHQNADEKHGRTGNGTLTSGGVDNTSSNTGDMSNYPCNSTACIRGDDISSWEINVNDIQNDALRNKILAEIESHLSNQNERIKNQSTEGDQASTASIDGTQVAGAYSGMYDIDGRGWFVTGDQLNKMKANPERFNLSPAEIKMIQRLKVKRGNEQTTQVAHYEPQGELISDLPESKDFNTTWSKAFDDPKHVNVDTNQAKRWFKSKDVKPVYPQKAPPKMVNGRHPKLALPELKTAVPQIKVTKKDLLRNHFLKKDEADEMINLVNNLNKYIKENPNQLAYARQRYPMYDVRLAELNFKLDRQLEAADEYIEKQFPENQKLFDKIKAITKKSIELTDPKTYENKNGDLMTFNKLARVESINGKYESRSLKLKKSNKKSASRFFFKPKEKTRDEILNDKMSILDKEMKKTMPDV